MATDYDAPRRTEESEIGEDSLEELKARRTDSQSGSVDVDEAEVAEGFELPGADLSGEELTVKVLPMQNDEFRCSQCFLVHHRSQLAEEKNGQYVCTECAACLPGLARTEKGCPVFRDATDHGRIPGIRKKHAG